MTSRAQVHAAIEAVTNSIPHIPTARKALQALATLFDEEISDMTHTPTYWASTASSKVFDFDNPMADMIDLPALAHHLSKENRWSNNLQYDYSVAQHSLLVASNIPVMEWRIYGLLHDAAEFVTRDLSTPFKSWLAKEGADVHGLERRILQAVWQHFDLPQPAAKIAASVDLADARALATEHRDVVMGKVPSWAPQGEPFSKPIKYQHHMQVMDDFVEMAELYLHAAHEAGLRRAA
jgi:hypothetical protein